LAGRRGYPTGARRRHHSVRARTFATHVTDAHSGLVAPEHVYPFDPAGIGLKPKFRMSAMAVSVDPPQMHIDCAMIELGPTAAPHAADGERRRVVIVVFVALVAVLVALVVVLVALAAVFTARSAESVEGSWCGRGWLVMVEVPILRVWQLTSRFAASRWGRGPFTALATDPMQTSPIRPEAGRSRVG
jgi:hypothetical protein